MPLNAGVHRYDALGEHKKLRAMRVSTARLLYFFCSLPRARIFNNSRFIRYLKKSWLQLCANLYSKNASRRIKKYCIPKIFVFSTKNMFVKKREGGGRRIEKHSKMRHTSVCPRLIVATDSHTRDNSDNRAKNFVARIILTRVGESEVRLSEERSHVIE